MSDDNYKDASKPTASKGCLNLIINGILAYFFYQYAYNNPDEG